MTPLLESQKLYVAYGDMVAVHGIDLVLRHGEALAIIGANGAGKSTFLKAVTGLQSSRSGTVLYDGAPIEALHPRRIFRKGIALVPEGRRLFSSLTIEENLRLGQIGSGRTGNWDLERVYALFPALRERRTLYPSDLSGGQQQMVAIGRALLSNPEVLICDEISLGLAPSVIKDIYAALETLKGKMAMIVVEQSLEMALSHSDRFYCLMEGRVKLTGRSAEAQLDQVKQAYFGSTTDA
ncbi:ABC transporter ATP-binding protein [uncultured Tateyamaria sp.]|uniref:ABC transporter ATP-binding protein n=1 Tax=uncultured Tateyamaria sp. TaxID=455651 RepID=UPI00262F16A6|nr:ABC transporter ATP-binding protein [uncultured Tateyamaria sp.]